MQVDPPKVEAIQDTKAPTNVKESMRFMGHIKWDNRFLPYLSNIYAPLTKLTKKDEKFVWSKQ
eukprot:c40574_g1_i1 orf=178-366(-)